MAGIHLHHHDLADEGPDAIAAWLGRLDDLTEVFVQVNDIFERNPSPVGTLPRNPVHVVHGTGRLYADVDAAALSPSLHQDQTGATDDPLGLVSGSTLAAAYDIVPWVNILNGAWSGDVAGSCVVDFRGRQITRWLCPNAPAVTDMWVALLGALVDRYGFERFLIDRIRYPDWGGEQVSPANLFTCFCDVCRAAMTAEGLAVEDLRAVMTEVSALAEDGEFLAAGERLRTDPLIQAWVGFRQRSVTALVARLVEGVRRSHPRVELWLDLWPPAYSWALGQDYASLTALSPRLKHFPYHRLGGGADVQSFVDHFAADDDGREQVFAAFTRMFGLDYGQTYADFRAHGFPIRLVSDQNALVRRSATPGTYVWSGVQMWNLPREELWEAAVASYASAADDVIYYCYGWAADDLFGVTNGAREEGRHG